MAEFYTIGDALLHGAARLDGLETGRRDAELLLMHVLGRNRAYLLTHPEAPLTPEQTELYEGWLARRVRHEPIQYITGEQEFFGSEVPREPGCADPAPGDGASGRSRAGPRGSRAASRKSPTSVRDRARLRLRSRMRCRLAHITALDISPAALAVARSNAEMHSVLDRIRFYESDLLEAVAGESFDMIVSNPPYVAEDEVLDPQVRDYEPASALFAGAVGLDVYRRLIPQAQAALKPGGWLLLEIGHGQRDALAQLLSGWNSVSFVADLQGIPRVACLQRARVMRFPQRPGLRLRSLCSSR